MKIGEFPQPKLREHIQIGTAEYLKRFSLGGNKNAILSIS